MEMTTWLPVAWFAVIGFGVLMYVVLDGFVLGIGILAPMAEDEEQLDVMMNTAAPIWDGNETWLVLGGAGLMAAFPKAYAAMLSALYLPVLLLVVALVFRGVAFEFRFKAHRSRRLWSVAFGLGSLLAAFAQGVILGALVQGRHRVFLTHRAGHEDERYIRAGGAHDLQGLVAGEAGHAQVREHDVRQEALQRLAQFIGALDPLETGLKAGIEHLLAHQFSVFRRVFDQQDTQCTQRRAGQRHGITRVPEPG